MDSRNFFAVDGMQSMTLNGMLVPEVEHIEMQQAVNCQREGEATVDPADKTAIASLQVVHSI